VAWQRDAALTPVARPKVFISYTQPDRDVAHELVSRVEAHGIECWIAPRDVLPGEDWPGAITSAIYAARVMVLVFSATANSSPQVRNEVLLALDKGLRVVPFRIADVALSASLEYALIGQYWLDAFPPPLGPHYASLCNCLDNILATPTSPLPHPDPPPSSSTEPRPSHPHARVTLEAANVRRLEHDLAVYIGPFAKWVVNRAAGDASNVDALLVQLGGQIDSETERQKFIDGCRQWLRAEGGTPAAERAIMTREAPQAQPAELAPTRVARSMAEAPSADSPHAVLDEAVQCTVFRPRQLVPTEWQPLLAFAHLGSPDSDAEVKRQAEAVLKHSIAEYRQVVQDAQDAVPRDTVVRFVPLVPGVEFEPAERGFSWRGRVHLELFLARALPQMLGQTARGSLSVNLGALAITQLPLTMPVVAAQAVDAGGAKS
jgi:hypothetical protein